MNTPRTGRATDFDEVLGLVRQGKLRAWSAVNAAIFEMVRTGIGVVGWRD
jgi:hypothetical protein